MNLSDLEKLTATLCSSSSWIYVSPPTDKGLNIWLQFQPSHNWSWSFFITVDDSQLKEVFIRATACIQQVTPIKLSNLNISGRDNRPCQNFYFFRVAADVKM